ncbi:OpgC family protein [Palleronia sp. THAF1]|uniref:OpgC family protein n=1 Tax=Palleronia sp. THAF1 TaxID=2587842 RepID=UPI000F51B496|nr:OpgC domain-containing protein [Palleronia sp. THAF1]
MTITADQPPRPIAAAPHPRAATGGVRIRDPRLDFYRGMAMFFIFIAHTPGNVFNSWIPARFGFSDATEIFVFCSGMASAIAFGAVFDRAGWRLGTVRVGHRVWQIYWAHLGLFLACATFLAALDQTGAFDTVYIGTLNLWKFFQDDPGPLLVGLMTLTYVPNYFDILPMYLAILLMLPIVMALARLHPAAAGGFVVVLWLLAQSQLWSWGGLGLPAEPWSDRRWFFNPFAWQLIFFTGFALMRGWLPTPPVRTWLVLVAAAIVVAFALMSDVAIREAGQTWARDWRGDNPLWVSKSNFGILRYLHFLALAYLAWVIAGPGGRALNGPDLPVAWRRFVAVVTKVGQQSLAVFLFSMFWARVTGFGLDQVGRDFGTVALANAIGFALMIALAYGVGWIKGQPWKAPRP